MKKKKLIINITIILSFILVFNVFAYGDSTTVVTLGKNLDEDQRKQILEIFNVNKDR